MRVKFHLDEHMPLGTARALRKRGIDVTTAAEHGLRGADDPDQLTFTRTQRRVMVTCDDDYLSMHAKGVAHAGILFWTNVPPKVGQLYYWLALVYDVYEAEELNGRVEYLP